VHGYRCLPLWFRTGTNGRTSSAIMRTFTRAESEAITMKSLGYNETTYSDLPFKIAFSYTIYYAKII
jgi:hypothetical protein